MALPMPGPESAGAGAAPPEIGGGADAAGAVLGGAGQHPGEELDPEEAGEAGEEDRAHGALRGSCTGARSLPAGNHEDDIVW